MKFISIITLLFVFQSSVIGLSAQGSYVENRAITREEAVASATKDALQTYKSLDYYEIAVVENKKTWHILFILKNKALNGGGPEYFISKQTGKIKKKIYWQ